MFPNLNDFELSANSHTPKNFSKLPPRALFQSPSTQNAFSFTYFTEQRGTCLYFYSSDFQKTFNNEQ